MGKKDGLGSFHEEVTDVHILTDEQKAAAVRMMRRMGAEDLIEVLLPTFYLMDKDEPAGGG